MVWGSKVRARSILACAVSALLVSGCATPSGSARGIPGAPVNSSANSNASSTSDPCSYSSGKIVGALAGAGLGALLGNKAGDKNGALVGAVVGGITGYAIGREIDLRREKVCRIAQEQNVKVSFKDISQDLTIKDNAPGKLGQVVTVENTNGAGTSLFIENSGELSPAGMDFYKSIAGVFVDSKRKVLVVGHSSDSGDPIRNQELTEARAKSVGQLLAKNGIRAENIYYQGAGESLPMEANRYGFDQNTRIDVIEIEREETLAPLASKRAVNPALFRKYDQPAIEAPTIKTESNKDKAPFSAVTVAKTEQPAKSGSKKATKSQTAKTEVAAAPVKLEAREEAVIKPLIDIGWHSNTPSPLKLTAIGKLKANNSFSFVSDAKADEPGLTCLTDRPHVSGQIKNLATEKVLTMNASEFAPGLGRTSWIETFRSGYTAALFPIGVYRDGTSAIDPVMSFYKKDGKQVIANNTYKTVANSYPHENGVLYRVYATKPDAAFTCADLVFKTSGEKQYKAIDGKLYYRQPEGVLWSDYTPAVDSAK